MNYSYTIKYVIAILNLEAVATDMAANFHCTIHTAVNYSCTQECHTFKFKATDTATYEYDTIHYVLDACASRLTNQIDAFGNFIS